MGLPRMREYWFKKLILGQEVCNWFLKPEHQNMSWVKGIPRAWIMDEWRVPLEVL
jgi:hypothetical protein